MREKNIDEVYLFQLEKAFKQFRKYKNGIFKERGIDITSDQWILLKRIHEEEGINQTDLARKAFKEPASVTRILDIMQKKGLVERHVVADNRREYQLFTSAEGKKLVEKLLPLAREIRATGTAGFTKTEVDQLHRLLERVFYNFNQ
ncbi:MAG: MarR family transcriptional regulator [Bacteroidetes bacterium]|nr:MarR family transcriptional regulator [Bacteroidota bacterium]